MKFKGIFILILLLSLTQLNGQSNKIKGVQKHCQNNTLDWSERYLKLKKGTETIRDSIGSEQGKFEIKNLSKGSYSIEFINIFGQIISKEILVDKRKIKIELCLEDFKDTGEETFIEKLSTESKLQFSFNSSGCSHSKTEEIIFSRVNNIFFAEFNDNKSPLVKKELNREQIQYLIIFERKLRKMKDSMGDCTTEDSYYLTLENEELIIIDDSCDWDGYDKMKKEIFNLKE